MFIDSDNFQRLAKEVIAFVYAGIQLFGESLGGEDLLHRLLHLHPRQASEFRIADDVGDEELGGTGENLLSLLPPDPAARGV